jgi:primase-polymerase (primpol)-like protein
MAGDVAQAPITQLEHCRSNPIKPQNIPDALKGLHNWVVWKAFTVKHDGGFDKVPISTQTGQKVSHLEKNHQMCFQDALSAYRGGLSDGIGISLNSDPVAQNDEWELLYLIGVDLDKVQASKEKLDAAKMITKSVGSYCEISPSGTEYAYLRLVRSF